MKISSSSSSSLKIDYYLCSCELMSQREHDAVLWREFEIEIEE